MFIDAFARMIGGLADVLAVHGSVPRYARASQLEQAIWARKDDGLDGLVHHSDRGVQYLSILWVPIIRSGTLNWDNAEPAVSAACNGPARIPSQRSDELPAGFLTPATK